MVFSTTVIDFPVEIDFEDALARVFAAAREAGIEADYPELAAAYEKVVAAQDTFTLPTQYASSVVRVDEQQAPELSAFVAMIDAIETEAREGSLADKGAGGHWGDAVTGQILAQWGRSFLVRNEDLLRGVLDPEPLDSEIELSFNAKFHPARTSTGWQEWSRTVSLSRGNLEDIDAAARALQGMAEDTEISLQLVNQEPDSRAVLWSQDFGEGRVISVHFEWYAETSGVRLTLPWIHKGCARTMLQGEPVVDLSEGV